MKWGCSIVLWGVLWWPPLLLAAPPTCRSLEPLRHIPFHGGPVDPERFFELDSLTGTATELNRRAEILMGLGRWFDAGSVLQQAQKQSPDEVDTERNLGFLAFHQGDWDQAAAAFRRSQHLALTQQRRLDARLQLGQWALSIRQRPEVTNQLTHTEFPLAVALIEAERALFLDDPLAAQTMIAALPTAMRDHPAVIAMQARIAFCRGDDPSALLDQLQQRDPETLELALLRGDWAWKQGDWTEARQFYEQARVQREEDGRVWLRLGMLDQYQGETRIALDKLHRALALQPTGEGYLGEMALLLVRLGRYRDAERDLTQHLAQFPNDALALMARGYLALRQGDDVTALTYLRRALAQSPRESRILSYTAIALYRLKQVDEARDLLRQAHESAGMDPLSWQVATRLHRQQNELLDGLQTAATVVARWDYRLPLEAWGMSAGLTDPGATAAHWDLTALAFAQSLQTEQNPLLWATLGETRDFREQAQRLGRFRDPLTVGEDPLRDELLRRAGTLSALTMAVEGQSTAWGPRLGASHRGRLTGDWLAYALEGSATQFFEGGRRWEIEGEVGVANGGAVNGFTGGQRRQLDLDDQSARHHQGFLGGQWTWNPSQRIGWLLQQDLTIYQQQTSVVDYSSQQLWTAGLRQDNETVQWGLSYQLLHQQRRASSIAVRDYEQQRERLLTGWIEGRRGVSGLPPGVTIQWGLVAQNIRRQDVLSRSDTSKTDLIEIRSTSPNSQTDGGRGVTRKVVQQNSRFGPRLGLTWQINSQDVLRFAYQDGYRTRADLQPLTLAGIPIESRYVEPGGRLRRLAAVWERQWHEALFTRLLIDTFDLDNQQQVGIKSEQAERLQSLENLFRADRDLWDDLEGSPRYDTGELWRIQAALDQGLSAQWSWFLRYRYLSSQNTGDHQFLRELDLPYLPRHAGAIGVKWHGVAGFQLSARAIYRGTRYRDEGNLSPLDAGWDMALRGEWQSSRRDWVVQAMADHLLNREAQSFYGLSVEYRY